MVSEGIPGELRNCPVILMQVVSEMRKDEPGIHLLLERFEVLFDLVAIPWEEAVAKILNPHNPVSRRGKETVGAPGCLRAPDSCRGKYYPRDLDLWVGFNEPENSATATDLDII